VKENATPIPLAHGARVPLSRALADPSIWPRLSLLPSSNAITSASEINKKPAETTTKMAATLMITALGALVLLLPLLATPLIPPRPFHPLCSNAITSISQMSNPTAKKTPTQIPAMLLSHALGALPEQSNQSATPLTTPRLSHLLFSNAANWTPSSS